MSRATADGRTVSTVSVRRSQDLLQRLRSLESRLHLVEDESQSKDRQIQDLLTRLENLVSAAGADAQDDLTQRLQVRAARV